MKNKFNIGDRVSPCWNTEGNLPKLTGTIINYDYYSSGGSWIVYTIDWDQDTLYARQNKIFAESNLKLLEKDNMKIKLKPIQSEAEITGGNWTHVVIDNNTKKIIAAFTNEEDASNYIDYTYCCDDYVIREVDNG